MFAAEVESWSLAPRRYALSASSAAYSCVAVTRSLPRPSLNAIAAGLAAAVAWAVALSATPLQAQPAGGGHVTATLVADAAGIAPGGAIHVALDQKIAPGWHTYWRNPGDSGQATTLTWTLPAGWSAGDIVWAAPKKLPIGPLMDYGYEGEVLLPVTVTAPAGLAVGSTVALKARADYLVCKDICVPEGADLVLDLPVTAGPPPVDPQWAGPIAAALAAAPKPAGLKAALTPGGALKLSITGLLVKGGDFPGAYFYPYDSTLIDHAQVQTIERGPDGLTLSLTPGSAFKEGATPSAASGVLSLGAKTIEIDAAVGPPLPGAAGLGPPAKPLTPAERFRRLAVALASAFVGGLILNLMPCVFPILSMKAVALARQAHSRASAAHGLAFMAGVVATFLALAGALIATRAAGQAVGWGFQLQSPPVVAALALVMLLAALQPVRRVRGGREPAILAGEAGGADKGGLAWARSLTGALAVAVAAPCTAPFMAGAIGFALTQGTVVALSIFLALGLGPRRALHPAVVRARPAAPAAAPRGLDGRLQGRHGLSDVWGRGLAGLGLQSAGGDLRPRRAPDGGGPGWLRGLDLRLRRPAEADRAAVVPGRDWRSPWSAIAMVAALALAFWPMGARPSAAVDQRRGRASGQAAMAIPSASPSRRAGSRPCARARPSRCSSIFTAASVRHLLRSMSGVALSELRTVADAFSTRRA